MSTIKKPYYGENLFLGIWLDRTLSESTNPVTYIAHSLLGAGLMLKTKYIDLVTFSDIKIRRSRLEIASTVLKRY